MHFYDWGNIWVDRFRLFKFFIKPGYYFFHLEKAFSPVADKRTLGPESTSNILWWTVLNFNLGGNSNRIIMFNLTKCLACTWSIERKCSPSADSVRKTAVIRHFSFLSPKWNVPFMDLLRNNRFWLMCYAFPFISMMDFM